MDGNGRWAERRGLPRSAGHLAGVFRINSVVKTLLAHHVKYLTLYGFSSENWNRPEEEVKGLFSILEDNIDQQARDMNALNVKILHLGRIYELPEGVRKAITRAGELTKNNTGLTLYFAFNYGGRIELVDSARRLIESKIPAEKVDEKVFAQHLYSPELPDPDLIIRTGGELRISNFLLWQAAYAEYYFTKVLWPDFTPGQMKRALQSYSNRQRRFGGV
jgi:undecaprenyl diphosphate synthase